MPAVRVKRTKIGVPQGWLNGNNRSTQREDAVARATKRANMMEAAATHKAAHVSHPLSLVLYHIHLVRWHC